MADTTLPVRMTVQYDDPQNDVILPNYEEKFYSGGMFRKPLKVVNTDGFKTVDITNIFGTLYQIRVVARDSFDPPPVTTLRLTINDGMNPVYHMDLPVEKFFTYNVHRSFAPFITGAAIKTSSITLTSVEIVVISRIDPPAPV